MTLSQGMTELGRGLARMAMALLLVLFALTPALDAVACAGDEKAPSVAAAHGSLPSTAVVEVHDHGGAADLHGLCAHGHCHHAAAGWPLREPVLAPARFAAAAERPALTRLPPSLAPTGLERPPRA